MYPQESRADESVSPQQSHVETFWLKLLTDVANHCHGLPSEQAVAAVLVDYALQFGFERTRLWRVSDNGDLLEGLAQGGAFGLLDFEGLQIPLDRSSFGRYMPQSRAARCFGPEQTPYLTTLFGDSGFQPPRGMWINVPLWGDEQLRGVLTLDSVTKEATASSELLNVLSLYGWQASAALERARNTYERDWLQVVAAVAEEAQRATTEQEIYDVSVHAGLRFGFARARLWQLSSDGESLIGVHQAANIGLDTFIGFTMPIAETRYLRTIRTQIDPICIPGRRELPGYLDHHFAATGFEPPPGKWVCIPLWVSGQLWGTLMLDSGEERLPQPDQYQVRLLRLLARQIEAALERLSKRNERDWLQVLTEVGARVQGALSEREVADIVVEGGLRLGFTRARLWKLSDDGATLVGLSQSGNQGLSQFIGLRVPLEQTILGTILQKGHTISIFDGGPRPILLDRLFEAQGFSPPAGQWVEIPLWADSRPIGTLTLDNADRREDLPGHHRNLLTLFGAQVAAALDRANRYERERLRSEELELLSWASTEVARTLSERPAQSEWLWDALVQGIVLARATFGFSRALLFLGIDSTDCLRGQSAATVPQIRRRPPSTRKQLAAFVKQRLKLLSTGRYPPSSLQLLTRRSELRLDDVPAVRATLQSGHRCIVPAEEAADKLPAAFLERFGVADYAILPLYAGPKLLGVVVVDSILDGSELRRGSLDQLEAFLTRVVLTYEIMRQRRAREELILLNHTVVANMRGYALRDILLQIAAAVREATRADTVTIYPFRASNGTMAYDEEALARVGGDPIRLARLRPRQRGITSHIVNTGTLMVKNVQTDKEHYDGRPLKDYGLLQQEHIHAFIGTPIRDVERGETLGVLYVDYLTPQVFGPFDRAQVESFASLAYLAIDNARHAQSIRAHLGAHEDELKILKRVLEEALVIDLNGGETRIVRSLLDAARDLLRPTKTDAWVGLLLSKWDHPHLPHEQTRHERHRYYWNADGQLACDTELDSGLGITGMALQTATPYRTGNVRSGHDAALFRQGIAQNTCSELVVPIVLEPEHVALGVFNIESPLADAFTETHQGMIERLAAVASLALGNLQRLRYLHDMLTAIRAVTTSGSLGQILDTVREAARDIAPGIAAWTIWYREPENKRITLGPYFGVQHEERMPAEASSAEGVVARVMQMSEPTWAKDATSSVVLRGSFVESERIVSAAAFPLRASGEAVGAMFFNYRAPHEFSAEERLFFPMIAAIAATGIQQALRFEATKEERDRLHAAMAITEAVGTSLDRSQVLPKILETLQRLFPATSIFVVTYNRLDETLVFTPESRDFYKIDHPSYVERTSFPLDGQSIASCLARQSRQTGEVAMANVADVSTNPHYLGLIASTQSELCLTLVSDGHLLGALVLESAILNAFNNEDEALVRSVGYQIGLALDRAHQSAQLRFKTALAARTAWAAEIAHDINTELGNIRNLVYLLQHTHDLPDAILSDIDEIASSAKRLAGTFHESQPVHARAIGPLYVDQLVRSAVATIHLGQSIAVELNLTCNQATILGSEVTIRRLLHHLIRNAREAMNGSGTLHISTNCDGSRVYIAIADSGPGIADAQREQIFNQPVTTKDREGGLGLLFVRSIIEDLGGTIRLLPEEPNSGAVFVIALPQSHALGDWKE